MRASRRGSRAEREVGPRPERRSEAAEALKGLGTNNVRGVTSAGRYSTLPSAICSMHRSLCEQPFPAGEEGAAVSNREGIRERSQRLTFATKREKERVEVSGCIVEIKTHVRPSYEARRILMSKHRLIREKKVRETAGVVTPNGNPETPSQKIQQSV